MHQSHNAAFGVGRGGGWEKPSLGLGNTSGLLAVAAAVLQGKTAAPGTNFSPYIERPSIQESPPSSRTGRSQGHNRRGKFSFPVTQSSSHRGIFSANATQVKAAVADGKAQGAFPHGPVTRSAFTLLPLSHIFPGGWPCSFFSFCVVHAWGGQRLMSHVPCL